MNSTSMGSLLDLFSTGRYDSDKEASGYLVFYEEIFNSIKNDPIKLMELGIFKGSSLLLWQDYFPNGIIVGLDLELVKVEGDRIRTYKGEQQDGKLLHQISNEIAPDGWDVIIDDASHMADPTRISFWHLFERLKPGGIYVIEDWGTGYWDSWPDGKRYHENHHSGMVGFIKELIDEVGIGDITNPKHGRPPQRASVIKELRIHPGMAVVIKGSQPVSQGSSLHDKKFKKDIVRRFCRKDI